MGAMDLWSRFASLRVGCHDLISVVFDCLEDGKSSETGYVSILTNGDLASALP